jgi:NAD(P)-dependent dehydrogenase (short-subunit alcohol dehydrogenase family)
MTKHAVVGLSLALRTEAPVRGVGVLTVCPAVVEIPILDKGAIGGFVGRDLPHGPAHGIPPRHILPRHNARHRAKRSTAGETTTRAHAASLFARLAPGLMQRMSTRFIEGRRARQAAARSRIR